MVDMRWASSSVVLLHRTRFPWRIEAECLLSIRVNPTAILFAHGAQHRAYGPAAYKSKPVSRA